MKIRLIAFAFALAITGFQGAGSAHAQTGGLRAGTLECNLEGRRGFVIGSSRTLGCTFTHVANMPPERYSGTMTVVGIDVGVTTNARMIWSVLAPTNNVAPGALAGRYSGVTAQVTATVGVSANALVGGFNNSFVLNPISLGGQTGLNLAAGVARLRLEPVPAAAPAATTGQQSGQSN